MGFAIYIHQVFSRDVNQRLSGVFFFLSRSWLSRTLSTVYALLHPTEPVLSVGEVCEILVLNRLNSPRALYKVQDWADQISTIDLFCTSSDLALPQTHKGLRSLARARNMGYFEGAYDDSD
jgi:hypothetical protein